MNLDDLIGLASQYSWISGQNLRNLYHFVHLRMTIDGAVVQCGVGNGGSAVLLWHACGGGRELWMFDSWQGLPRPKEKDGGRAGAKWEHHKQVYGQWCRGYLRNVRKAARLGGVPKERTHCVKGWFNKTLPVHAGKIGPIAMLHLDADWHESTLQCLEHLYPLLEVGGLMILDDYGHWPGVEIACREYGIVDRLTITPPCGAYMIKEAE